MKDQKEHIDIDLEFLDKKEPIRVAPKKPEPLKANESKAGDTRKYNWKNILIISGVVLFFGWVIFSGSSDSNSNSAYTPTTNSNNLLAEGGNTFRCSDSNYDRAMQLKPSASIGAQLAIESSSLDTRISASKAEKTALDSMYVDENDQYAIDSYNARVDSYNSERTSLISESNNWDARHTAFDNQIDTYNNFLDTNCTQQ